MCGGPDKGRLFQLANARSILARLGCLLWQEHSLDVGQDSTLSNGHATQELVELLVVSNRKLQMSRDDTRLLVISSSISSQLQDFCCQVLQDCGQVDGCPSPDPLGIVSLTEKAVDTTNGKLQTGTG